jgi:hypothetical protein
MQRLLLNCDHRFPSTSIEPFVRVRGMSGFLDTTAGMGTLMPGKRDVGKNRPVNVRSGWLRDGVIGVTVMYL